MVLQGLVPDAGPASWRLPPDRGDRWKRTSVGTWRSPVPAPLRPNFWPKRRASGFATIVRGRGAEVCDDVGTAIVADAMAGQPLVPGNVGHGQADGYAGPAIADSCARRTAYRHCRHGSPAVAGRGALTAEIAARALARGAPRLLDLVRARAVGTALGWPGWLGPRRPPRRSTSWSGRDLTYRRHLLAACPPRACSRNRAGLRRSSRATSPRPTPEAAAAVRAGDSRWRSSPSWCRAPVACSAGAGLTSRGCPCDRHGAYLIADEVSPRFGRNIYIFSGPGTAHFGIRPDLIASPRA